MVWERDCGNCELRRVGNIGIKRERPVRFLFTEWVEFSQKTLTNIYIYIYQSNNLKRPLFVGPTLSKR